jgi:hypothetical protein
MESELRKEKYSSKRGSNRFSSSTPTKFEMVMIAPHLIKLLELWIS